MKRDVQEIFDAVVGAVKMFKPKEIIKFEQGQDNTVNLLPKKTKILGRAFLKEIFSTKDNRLLILVGHLYLENFLIEIIKHKFKNYEELEKSKIIDGFYKKVKLLESQGYLTEDIVNDLLMINGIRNKFVHNLNYQINRIDVFKFYHLKIYKNYLNIKNKEALKSFNRLIIKQVFFWSLIKLTQRYRFIHLMNV